MTHTIPESLASQYKGAGYALAALTNGQIVAIQYVRDVAPEHIADAIEGSDAHAEFFMRQWLASAQAGPVVRELQALGDVLAGMCSCWEFVEL